jgi:ribonucleoside-diphosphate reductase alpha chain
MSVKIDYSKDSLLDDFAHATLKDRYMVGDETSPQEAFARAAMAFADDEDHAQRLYDYVSNGLCLQPQCCQMEELVEDYP